MLYRRVDFEIAASSASSPTGKTLTQWLERMQLVGTLYHPRAPKHDIYSETGIPCDYLNMISHGFLQKGETDQHKVAQGRQKYDAALAERVLSPDRERPDLIVLAGWMHVFSTAFLEPIERAGVRIINLHPALPGKFWR